MQQKESKQVSREGIPGGKTVDDNDGRDNGKTVEQK